MKINKYNRNETIIGNIRLQFNIPIKNIKTVKCRICNEYGDLFFCAEHIKNNTKNHFDKPSWKNSVPMNSSNRAFDVIEKYN